MDEGFLTPELAMEQLKIYAKELGELYEEEKKKREELAQEKIVLEMKLKELKALNEMFQSHIEKGIEAEEKLKSLLSSLKELLKLDERRLKEEILKLLSEFEGY